MITSPEIISPSLSCVLSVQFADGVILLLLIGQLEGFFVPLGDFYLTPVNPSEMVWIPDTLAKEVHPHKDKRTPLNFIATV